MNMYVKFDVNAICKRVLEKQLDSFGLEYTLSGTREMRLMDKLSKEKEQELADALGNVGIFIVDDTKAILAHQIKETIIHMIYTTKRPIAISHRLIWPINYIIRMPIFPMFFPRPPWFPLKILSS